MSADFRQLINRTELKLLGLKTDICLQPSDSKVTAIVEAPPPKNVSELKLFLGMVNYYGKFLPNLSTSLAHLYLLLRKETPWQ